VFVLFLDKIDIRIVIAENDEDQNAEVSYKHLDFECDAKTASDLESKVNHIISYVNSSFLNEYRARTRTTITTKWSRKAYKR
jgi:hypothetical protein